MIGPQLIATLVSSIRLRIDLHCCNKAFFLDIDFFFKGPLFLHVATVSQVQSWGKHAKGICNEPILVNDSNVWSQGISSLALLEILSFYLGYVGNNDSGDTVQRRWYCSVSQGTT